MSFDLYILEVFCEKDKTTTREMAPRPKGEKSKVAKPPKKRPMKRERPKPRKKAPKQVRSAKTMETMAAATTNVFPGVCIEGPLARDG